MKKLLLGSLALFAMVSCSKESENQMSKTSKKAAIPSAEAVIHQTFVDFIDDYAAGDPDDEVVVDLEYAAWLLEGSLNYRNRGDGDAPIYVDITSKATDTWSIPYSVVTDEGNVSLQVTETTLHNLFTDLVSSFSGYAAITDLEIIGDTYLNNGFNLQITGYASTAPVAYTYPCPITPVPNTVAHSCRNPGSGTIPSVCQTNHSSDFIGGAIDYLNQRHNKSCHLSYYTYGHSIERLEVNNLPSAYNSLDWKLVDPFINAQAQVAYVSAGTGTNHSKRLYGADTYTGSYIGGATSSSILCMNKTDMDVWVNLGQAIVDIEDPNVNTNTYFTDLNVFAFAGGTLQLYGYHYMYLRQVQEINKANVTYNLGE